MKKRKSKRQETKKEHSLKPAGDPLDELKGHTKRHVHPFSVILQVIIFLTLAGLASLTFIADQDPLNLRPDEALPTNTINETPPVETYKEQDIPVSIERYTAAIDSYLNTPANITARLGHKAMIDEYSSGKHEYYLLDDYGNMIDVGGSMEGLRGWFPENGETEDVYQVQGMFTRSLKGIAFEIRHIKESTRETERVPI